jgi:hypothetical protein
MAPDRFKTSKTGTTGDKVQFRKVKLQAYREGLEESLIVIDEKDRGELCLRLNGWHYESLTKRPGVPVDDVIAFHGQDLQRQVGIRGGVYHASVTQPELQGSGDRQQTGCVVINEQDVNSHSGGPQIVVDKGRPRGWKALRGVTLSEL